MNSTVGFTYFDSLDGEYMACSGSPEVQEYTSTCIYLRYVLGTICTVQSVFYAKLWLEFKLIYDERKEAGNTSFVTLKTGGSSRTSRVAPPPLTTKVRPCVKFGVTALKLCEYSRDSALCVAVILASAAVSTFVSGFGTAYSRASTLGQVGDLFMALFFGFTWHFSYIKEKQSAVFESIVELPGDWSSQQQSWVSTLNTAYGRVHKFLSIPIAFGIWALLALRVLDRRQYFIVIHAGQIVVGVRMFYISVSKRLFTLSKVRNIQRKCGGMRARGRQVEKKARRLIIEMVVSMITTILSPLSIIVLGSTRSSAQMALHRSVIMSLSLVALAGFLLSLRKQLREEDAERCQGGAGAGDSEATQLSESSLSNVSSWGKPTAAKGLFSEVASDT